MENQSVIKKENLCPYHKDSEGNVKGYSAHLSDIEIVKENRELYNKYSFEIRHLIRSESNLRDSFSYFHQLLTYFDEKMECFFDRERDFEIKALHTCGIMSYRACFVKGEKGKFPLEFLHKQFEDNTTHKSLKLYGDKLYGHLDKNIELREDHIQIQLTICEDYLEPTSVKSSGTFVTVESYAQVTSWIEHNKFTQDLVKKEQKRLNGEMKKIIGIIKIKK
ncbi:MAG: hypothetical protein COW00_11920 [Bdellovibrio sp. CG12_big_fil_rev_8_21_14_0_65_39_13]|nr:MAG: hypothetical protein COW78_00715 [Bdellovibrio sp. CG22_combo_CG10-13_8_21_14_all_39_27]PIQ59161.1 MAG: hypothetical protein COW00_11920 [Bdellovibrio sp. CG12_big_fil_rev_8_21_14_0_65_39_13]PIR33301.1 MAG: hypothetical protein COV37_16710 [Bdellovibrio sp. CG11_big_fil_rev_8_21_14_0_20_39_38]